MQSAAAARGSIPRTRMAFRLCTIFGFHLQSGRFNNFLQTKYSSMLLAKISPPTNIDHRKTITNVHDVVYLQPVCIVHT